LLLLLLLLLQPTPLLANFARSFKRAVRRWSIHVGLTRSRSVT
jgi:hypothetical protein